VGTNTRDASLPPAPEPLPVPVVDSHCHLDMAAGARAGEEPPGEALGVAQALDAAAAVGVDRVVQIGCDVEGSRWSVRTAQEHPHVWAGVALHPNEAPRLGPTELDAAFAEITELAADPVVRAIGETGLDHFRTAPEGRAVQEDSFRRHIELAKSLGKALVIHDRDAHEDVLRVLADAGAPDVVVFHCFSGDAEMARACVAAGYHLSFAGTVTFKNAQPLRDALVEVPAELLLVETDAPFLTPMPFRGRPNASYLIPHTMRVMAEVRGADLTELCTAVRTTSERVFGPL
jgi:TatD DNase family protein